MQFFYLGLFFCMLANYSFAQNALLKSGPMVGYSTMREVGLWVQTTKEAKVKFRYFDLQRPDSLLETETIVTQLGTGFIAKAVAKVLPSKKYEYQLLINNQQINLSYPLRFQSQVLWQHRTTPPDFKFAIGSCFYVNETAFDRPNSPYGSDYGIVKTIAAKAPDFMVWIGDNTYTREADWEDKSGFIHRYSHTRALPELQPLLGSVHQYATWDDHDFGPNDSDRSFRLKKTSEEVFNNFWMNQTTDLDGNGGITSSFTWNDAAFFLIDDRFHRAPNKLNDSTKAYFGDNQIQWLIESLVASNATFKFIVSGGQVINPAAAHENMATYPVERKKLLQAISNANIPGVVFLNGDRHFTELNKLERAGKYPLYELTCSSLTAGISKNADKENNTRQEGTLVKEHNFGLLEIVGEKLNRTLRIQIINKDGQSLWQKEIKASELL